MGDRPLSKEDLGHLRELAGWLREFLDRKKRNFSVGGAITGGICRFEDELGADIDWWPFEFYGTEHQEVGMTEEKLDELTARALRRVDELLKDADDL